MHLKSAEYKPDNQQPLYNKNDLYIVASWIYPKGVTAYNKRSFHVYDTENRQECPEHFSSSQRRFIILCAATTTSNFSLLTAFYAQKAHPLVKEDVLFHFIFYCLSANSPFHGKERGELA